MLLRYYFRRVNETNNRYFEYPTSYYCNYTIYNCTIIYSIYSNIIVMVGTTTTTSTTGSSSSKESQQQQQPQNPDADHVHDPPHSSLLSATVTASSTSSIIPNSSSSSGGGSPLSSHHPLKPNKSWGRPIVCTTNTNTQDSKEKESTTVSTQHHPRCPSQESSIHWKWVAFHDDDNNNNTRAFRGIRLHPDIFHFPKSALNQWYGQRYRSSILFPTKSDFFTITQQHAEYKYTSVFVCPVTGQIYPSGPWGDDYQTYPIVIHPNNNNSSSIHDDNTTTTNYDSYYYYYAFKRKQDAEHAAAAQAYDSLIHEFHQGDASMCDYILVNNNSSMVDETTTSAAVLQIFPFEMRQAIQLASQYPRGADRTVPIANESTTTT